MQDSYSLFYNILTNRLTDTASTARAGSDFIFSAWPNRGQDDDTKGRAKWVGYPIVVLTTNVDRGTNFTLKGSMRDWDLGVTIEVYNKSQAKADQMMDQVLKLLNDNQFNIEGSGLNTFRIESMTNMDFTDPGGALVHQKTLDARYSFRRVN